MTSEVDDSQIVSYDTIVRLAITEQEYHAFQVAYDFLNAELFGGTLPHVLVTLQRHPKAKGYFAAHRVSRAALATAGRTSWR